MRTDLTAPPPAAATVTDSTRLAIQADGLVKTYPARKRGGDPVSALRGISFAVPTGTVFGLLGPNGAGKSTSVKILTTLSRPDLGSAQVAGLDVVADPAAVRRLIGVVSQKSGADPDATGQENLLLQGRIFGITGAGLKQRVAELLERFDLGHAADRLVRTYSGGMVRRLDVAVGLVHRPSVMFLDEPTTGLDPEARAIMWDEIGRLAADGLSILLTTHYLEEADRLAATVAVVEDGRIVVSGSPEALKSEMRGDAVHLELDAPPTDDKVDAVRARLGAVPGVGEIRIEGRAVHARVGNGASSLPAVFAAFDGTPFTITAATVARPSLDDVYLRYVGRTFATDTTPEEVSS